MRDLQFSKKGLEPNKLSSGISNCLVLSFSATPRNCSLLPSTPGDQIRSREYCISPVDRRSSGLPTQSASLKTESILEGAARR